MLITLVGPDRYSVAQALRAHLAKHAPAQDGIGDLNLTRLDGVRITPDELARATQSFGFFDDKRVIVVEGLMSRFGAGRAADDDSSTEPKAETAKGRKADTGLADGFVCALGEVPDTTVLILVERGGVAKNNSLFKAAS